MSRCPGCGMKECCGADLEPQLQAAKERIEKLEDALEKVEFKLNHNDSLIVSQALKGAT